MPAPTEAELTAILAHAGLNLTAEQVRAILPGAAVMRDLIDRVNAPLPREAEPAVFFRAEQG